MQELKKDTKYVVVSRKLALVLSEHRSRALAYVSAKAFAEKLAEDDRAKVLSVPTYAKFIADTKARAAKAAARAQVDVEDIRDWLQDSRGQKTESGLSQWAEISHEAKVSIRTLTNICSGDSEAPRQKTLRGLEAVRKRMVRK